jgi:hypothetical protein
MSFMADWERKLMAKGSQRVILKSPNTYRVPHKFIRFKSKISQNAYKVAVIWNLLMGLNPDLGQFKKTSEHFVLILEN